MCKIMTKLMWVTTETNMTRQNIPMRMTTPIGPIWIEYKMDSARTVKYEWMRMRLVDPRKRCYLIDSASEEKQMNRLYNFLTIFASHASDQIWWHCFADKYFVFETQQEWNKAKESFYKRCFQVFLIFLLILNLHKFPIWIRESKYLKPI